MDSRIEAKSFSRIFMFIVLMGWASSDLSKDRTECADQLVGLATCLPYVGGDSKAPTPDCCTGLKEVLDKSKKCLCVLIKDRNDPGLGLKINATLALGLPDYCHASANISGCPELLHLAPNSPDAKIFEEYGNKTKSSSPVTTNVRGSNSSGNGAPPSAEIKSDGGRRKRWLGAEMIDGVLLWCFTSHLIFNA